MRRENLSHTGASEEEFKTQTLWPIEMVWVYNIWGQVAPGVKSMELYTGWISFANVTERICLVGLTRHY